MKLKEEVLRQLIREELMKESPNMYDSLASLEKDLIATYHHTFNALTKLTSARVVALTVDIGKKEKDHLERELTILSKRLNSIHKDLILFSKSVETYMG